MSGYLPILWNVGLEGGDIIMLSSEVNWNSLLPFGLVLRQLHTSFLEFKSTKSMVGLFLKPFSISIFCKFLITGLKLKLLITRAGGLTYKQIKHSNQLGFRKNLVIFIFLY